MKKISLRIEDHIVDKIDSLVDFVNVRNRSQAVKFLIEKAFGEEKIAVILGKGSDLSGQNLEKDLSINGEYSPTAKIKNTTLIEEQIKRLEKVGFNKIYIVTVREVIEKINEILKDKKIKSEISYAENKGDLKSADSLNLLKDKIKSEFLVIFSDIYFDLNVNELIKQKMSGKSIAVLTLKSYFNPSVKSSVELEGTTILSCREKEKNVKDYIVFEPVFMTDPRIFAYKGSLVYDVFPKIAKKRLLGGHLTTGKILHLHKKEDKEKLENLLKSR